jgi:hypothetical protein
MYIYIYICIYKYIYIHTHTHISRTSNGTLFILQINNYFFFKLSLGVQSGFGTWEGEVRLLSPAPARVCFCWGWPAHTLGLRAPAGLPACPGTEVTSDSRGGPGLLDKASVSHLCKMGPRCTETPSAFMFAMMSSHSW